MIWFLLFGGQPKGLPPKKTWGGQVGSHKTQKWNFWGTCFFKGPGGYKPIVRQLTWGAPLLKTKFFPGCGAFRGPKETGGPLFLFKKFPTRVFSGILIPTKLVRGGGKLVFFFRRPKTKTRQLKKTLGN